MPTLLSIFFRVILWQITDDRDDEDSVYLRQRMNGSLFNLRRLLAHTMTQARMIRDLLFEVDAAIVAHTEQAFQRIKSCFVDASRLLGLDDDPKKTVVLHKPISRDEHRPPHIITYRNQNNSLLT